MCDFSLSAIKSRPAKVGDKLVTRNFNTGTRGFAEAAYNTDGSPAATQDVAVCVLPGTELAFDAPIGLPGAYQPRDKEVSASVAIFRQINKDQPRQHHDALELPDGTTLLLTYLTEGQTATVLQLPAAPKNKEEEQDQKRVEYAG